MGKRTKTESEDDTTEVQRSNPVSITPSCKETVGVALAAKPPVMRRPVLLSKQVHVHVT